MANKTRTDIHTLMETAPYQDITFGNVVYGGGGAREFNTGEWRTQTPVVDWDKCVQCLLCALDHCKGCGICAGCCSFGAITMKEGL